MKLLDLFCGAGGCSVGYARAGFIVQGIDIEPHPDYPYTFVQADAMDVLTDQAYLNTFDVIHASPPCQQYTSAGHLMRAQGNTSNKLDLLAPVTQALKEWGGPYVIENVPGAPMLNPAQLCGSSFGLGVRRHRLFDSNYLLMSSQCEHEKQGRPIGVYGRPNDDIPAGGRTARNLAEGREAMGIDWMRWDDLKEAIPPAFTEYLGTQLLQHLGHADAHSTN